MEDGVDEFFGRGQLHRLLVRCFPRSHLDPPPLLCSLPARSRPCTPLLSHANSASHMLLTMAVSFAVADCAVFGTAEQRAVHHVRGGCRVRSRRRGEQQPQQALHPRNALRSTEPAVLLCARPLNSQKHRT
eukprot:2831266-Rhodomonas_salina.1